MLNALAISQSEKNLIIFCALALVLTAAIIITAKIIISKRIRYSVKTSLMSKTEQSYFEMLVRLIGERYIVFPQINLASVINKDTPGFRSELFRNADFGIFDSEYKPLLLVEINDSTHNMNARIERDKSVNKICKKARLPILTIWLKDNLSEEQIARMLRKYL